MDYKTDTTSVSSGCSRVSRVCNFNPDPGRIRKYDIYCRTNRRTYNILAIVSLFCIVAAVAAFTSRHWITGGLISMMTAVPFCLFLLYRRLLRRQSYENGWLVPGMIASLQPLAIIALADMRSAEEEDAQPRWACKKIEPETLPLHKLQVGEKVPCVALFETADHGKRTNFEPRPVSWATADSSNLERAVKSIDPGEWALLYDVIDREMPVSQTEVTLLGLEI